jgi:hypothetical protein
VASGLISTLDGWICSVSAVRSSHAPSFSLSVHDRDENLELGGLSERRSSYLAKVNICLLENDAHIALATTRA